MSTAPTPVAAYEAGYSIGAKSMGERLLPVIGLLMEALGLTEWEIDATTYQAGALLGAKVSVTITTDAGVTASVRIPPSGPRPPLT
jgi:hypothetical protein